MLCGIGVEVTSEVVNAAIELKKKIPSLRVRVVNVVDLLVLAEPGAHPHALDEVAFNSLFTKDKPIVFNFHGYPSAVAQLLFGRQSHVARNRITIGGYLEEGTTTTPYSMLRLNGCGRWDVIIKALKAVAAQSPKLDTDVHVLIAHYESENRQAEKYALESESLPRLLTLT